MKVQLLLTQINLKDGERKFIFLTTNQIYEKFLLWHAISTKIQFLMAAWTQSQVSIQMAIIPMKEAKQKLSSLEYMNCYPPIIRSNR